MWSAAIPDFEAQMTAALHVYQEVEIVNQGLRRESGARCR
jgi:hypothetical protein